MFRFQKVLFLNQLEYDIWGLIANDELRYMNHGGLRVYSFLKNHGVDITYRDFYEPVEIESYDLVLVSLIEYNDRTFQRLREVANRHPNVVAGGMLFYSYRSYTDTDAERLELFRRIKIVFGEGERIMLAYIRGEQELDPALLYKNEAVYDIRYPPEVVERLDLVPIFVNNRCTWRKCIFCNNNLRSDECEDYTAFRMKTGAIADQIEYYYRQGKRVFSLLGEETLLTEVKRVKQGLWERGLTDLSLYLYNTKIKSIDEFLDICEMHKESIRVRYATYAVETFDPEIFRLINKNIDADPQRIERMIDYFNRNRIGAEVNLIVGFRPGDDLATLEQIRRSVGRFDTVDINIMYLIPLFEDTRRLHYRYSRAEIDRFIDAIQAFVKERDNPNMQVSVFYSYDDHEFYCDYNYVAYIHKDRLLRYNLF